MAIPLSDNPVEKWGYFLGILQSMLALATVVFMFDNAIDLKVHSSVPLPPNVWRLITIGLMARALSVISAFLHR